MQIKKLLVITKRQYTNKDLINDKYGRVRELPLHLTNNKIEIKGYCLSYRRRPNETIIDIDESLQGHVAWCSISLGRFYIPGLILYVFQLLKEIKSNKPDAIWATSDAPHVVLGFFLGKIFNIPCIVDLYDNYEAFSLTNMPIVLQLYRYTIKHADSISCVSRPLKDKINTRYQPNGELFIIENGIPDNVFIPLEKTKCRHILGLPTNAKIIAYTGAIDKNRGIDFLLSTFLLVLAKKPDTHLVLAGHGKRSNPAMQHPNVHDLGVVSYDLIPTIINAADVNIILNQNNNFGKFCFPQKFFEIVACGTPLLAPSIGVTQELLNSQPDLLYDPTNLVDFKNKIIAQVQNPLLANVRAITWAEQAEKLACCVTATWAKRKSI